MARTDIHRPSAINPDDYQFVAWEYLREAYDDPTIMVGERMAIRAHMERTGGDYSRHQHGGNCHICGAAAVYTALFYHAPSNSYVRTGEDCAAKIEGGLDASAFRKRISAWEEARAGKNKARTILEGKGLAGAWTIYNATIETRTYDESVVQDMVDKLVRYGNLSDKAAAYLAKLVERIENAPAIDAARKAEAAAASPVPVSDKRMTVEGVVLAIKQPAWARELNQDVYKMLVRTDAGWKVYGSRPASLAGIERGARVQFDAKVTASKDDAKFGFYSRPTKARIMEAK